MRTRRMTIEQGRRVGIDRFPNFHKSGSVRGMKRLYYGKDCLLVRWWQLHLQCFRRAENLLSGNHLKLFNYV